MSVNYNIEWWGEESEIKDTNLIHHENSSDLSFTAICEKIREDMQTKKLLIVHCGSRAELKAFIHRVMLTREELSSGGDLAAMMKGKTLPYCICSTSGSVLDKPSIVLSIPDIEKCKVALKVLLGHKGVFDKLIMISDNIMTAAIYEKINLKWSFGDDGASKNCKSFISQHGYGVDKQYVDLGNWYKTAIEAKYRGNFRLGVAVDDIAFPMSIFDALIAFVRAEKWEMHVMSPHPEMDHLFKNALHFMAGCR